jgi:hypothetical protein
VPTVQLAIQPVALQAGAEFVDPETYQSIALRRVEEQIGVETFNTTKLIQYYSLYCIYAATNSVANAITDTDPRFDGLVVLPSWLISTGWVENNVDPCSGWFGISCQSGRVTIISLFDNVLLGAFPPEVSLLAADGPRATGAGSLIGIDLYNNEFLFNNFNNDWMEFLGTRLGKYREEDHCAEAMRMHSNKMISSQVFLRYCCPLQNTFSSKRPRLPVIFHVCLPASSNSTVPSLSLVAV